MIETLNIRSSNSNRIARALSAELTTGTWSVGDRLPSIRQLGQTFNATPETVRRAMLALAKNGVVELRHGSGTYVKSTTAHSVGKDGRVVVWMPPLHFSDHVFDILDRMQASGQEFETIVKRRTLTPRQVGNVSGVVVVAPSHEDLKHLREVVRRETPIVSISRSYADIPVPAVLEDNFHAAYDLTRWLISQGHSRIPFLGEQRDKSQSYMAARVQGWQAALTEAGKNAESQPIHWIRPREDRESVFEAMLPIFTDINFDALFCSSIVCLEEALRHAVTAKADLVGRHAIAGIDCPTREHQHIAHAEHDYERMFQIALDRLRQPSQLSIPTIDRVPMRLRLPDLDNPDAKGFRSPREEQRPAETFRSGQRPAPEG